mmetsp:Transcript_18511/g.26055  ORF Transcript_18511/g.26055 Transcript_18511/m.26055 type:complete len:217 (+) Transcript_18511:2771-3421(+)
MSTKMDLLDITPTVHPSSTMVSYHKHGKILPLNHHKATQVTMIHSMLLKLDPHVCLWEASHPVRYSDPLNLLTREKLITKLFALILMIPMQRKSLPCQTLTRSNQVRSPILSIGSRTTKHRMVSHKTLLHRKNPLLRKKLSTLLLKRILDGGRYVDMMELLGFWREVRDSGWTAQDVRESRRRNHLTTSTHADIYHARKPTNCTITYHGSRTDKKS